MARGRKPIGEQAMTAAERQQRRRASEKFRRTQAVVIDWGSDAAKIGRLTINGEFWGAVEWSHKRKAWCIEDAEGRCLAHAESIRGQAPTKEEAVALAREMIRDGRLPSPQQAKVEADARRAERGMRKVSPEVVARRRASSDRATARYKAEAEERQATPLWEAMHEVFDFSDPDLWRSNSFAVLRPRLIVHLNAAVAKLEGERDYYATTRRINAEARRRTVAQFDAKLARTREVLAAIAAA